MEALGLLFVISLVGFIYAIKKSGSKPAAEPNLKVKNVRFSPEPGSTLKAHEPIYVTFDYEYSSPYENLHAWARIPDETYAYTYEGSSDSLKPGRGTIKRYVYLTEPVAVSEIGIVIAKQNMEDVYRERYAVDYTFEINEEFEALREDGKGSKVTGTELSVETGSEIAAGTKVNVQIDYDVTAEKGARMWVIPNTNKNGTYEGSTGDQFGTGSISKYFIISEPCDLESVTIVMRNAANEVICEHHLDVNLRYV